MDGSDLIVKKVYAMVCYVNTSHVSVPHALKFSEHFQKDWAMASELGG